MGDTFLTSFFRFNANTSSNNNTTLDSQELTNRLSQLLSSDELQQLRDEQNSYNDEGDFIDSDTAAFFLNRQQSLVHFPHMLPDNHPQSVYLNSPMKHQLIRAEQKMLRLTRRLFHLSFAYKGAVYWVILYLFLRGPVEDTFKKTLAKLLAGTSQQQIAYTTVGVTATVAAALSASLSNSIHSSHDYSNNKRIDR